MEEKWVDKISYETGKLDCYSQLLKGRSESWHSFTPDLWPETNENKSE